MKKIIWGIITLMLMPMLVWAKDDLVKVYIFEANDCIFSKAEIDYLKGLDSYNKKFTIVTKESYVDTKDFLLGKDFVLNVKVANAFSKLGFKEAKYNSTPFIVISNIYAETRYNDDLEKIINEAYKKKDADVVGCIEKGKDNCVKGYKDAGAQKEAQKILEDDIKSRIDSCLRAKKENCDKIFENTQYKVLADELYDEVVKMLEAEGVINNTKNPSNNSFLIIYFIIGGIIIIAISIILVFKILNKKKSNNIKKSLS